MAISERNITMLYILVYASMLMALSKNSGVTYYHLLPKTIPFPLLFLFPFFVWFKRKFVNTRVRVYCIKCNI